MLENVSARTDWGWKNEFDLDGMTSDMLTHLKEKLTVTEGA